MSSLKNALSGASLAFAALLCAALTASAGDNTYLRPMIDIEQNWDSNVLNQSSGGEEGSLVTRVSPALWLENSGERGHARLGLTAVGRSVWSESDLSGIDGLARGDFERKVTPRFSVFGDGVLDHYSGYDAIGETGGPGNQGGQPILAEQPAWNRDRISGGFAYLLSPRLSVRLSGSGGRINYESIDAGTASEGDYRDQTIYGARSVLMYQLTALDQLSAGVDLDDTSFQDVGFGTNDSDIWSSYVGWTRNWTQFWSTSATIGFRALDSTQGDVPQSGAWDPCDAVGAAPCPQIQGLSARNFSNSGTGLIGSLLVKRTFARSSIELSYDRDTRSSGGAGRTNFDIDSFSLAWTQQLAARVRLTLSGNYSLYHSVTNDTPNYQPRLTGGSLCPVGGALQAVDVRPFLGADVPVFQCVGGSSEEKRKYTTLVARVEWQLRRRLSSYVVARYYRSITDQTFGSTDVETEDLDKFSVGGGFRYYYDLGL